MEKFLLQIFNMSLVSTFVILAVILLRIILKKAPKIVSYVLWSVVLFRLVCPYSFESIFSLLPSSSTFPPNNMMLQNPLINNGFKAISDTATFFPKEVLESASPIKLLLFVCSIIWIIGGVSLLTYGMVSYCMLKKKVHTSIRCLDNVYECEYVSSAFVLGVFKPKIYLPVGLSNIQRECIIKHEQIHIKRLDYITKLIAYITLCAHWFNPFVWVAFSLMSKDMELSCDEAVIKEMGKGFKQVYSETLLSLASRRRMLSISPLAFGESNVKTRIKNVLSYKKPTLWVFIIVIIAVIAIIFGLALNPKNIESSDIIPPIKSSSTPSSSKDNNDENIVKADAISSLDDWDALNYEGKISENCYNFFYNLLSGKSEIEEYNSVIISDYKISIADVPEHDSLVYLNFDFTVESSSLEALPAGKYHKIVADIIDCYLLDKVDDYEEDFVGQFKGIEEVEMVGRWISSGYVWDCPNFGEGKTGHMNYIISQYGENKGEISLDEYIRLSKEKLGIDVNKEDSSPYIFERDGIKYLNQGGMGGSFFYKVNNYLINGDVATVTVQFYADCNMLIPSHLVAYNIKKSGIWLGYDMVSRSKNQPYGLRALYNE